ncbi:uncharacterized protein YALI1_D13042g [Yarrowia lipolytica]|uniref:Uncharacterized protein n=1 Tax=Yarrowia lipolytica TaxID=4952 RepID=A0A1D8NE14_YARLL|nr:hypothetical protein YALI1_D13042g [Yarrowia lipolytica]
MNLDRRTHSYGSTRFPGAQLRVLNLMERFSLEHKTLAVPSLSSPESKTTTIYTRKCDTRKKSCLDKKIFCSGENSEHFRPYQFF